MSTLSPTSLPAPMMDAPVRPKASVRNKGDRAFFGIVTGGVLFVPVLVFLFLAVLLAGAWPAIRVFGLHFITSKQWDANAEGGEAFGALPFIYGTLVTGIAALLIAAPIGIA